MPFIASLSPPPPASSVDAQQEPVTSPHSPVLSSIGPTTTMDRYVQPTPSEIHTPSLPSKPAAVEEEAPRFPSATINAESISDVMAARLVTCLLGHVLFLKSQVPFPVAQLLKVSSKNTDPRANKKQDALLASFDLLSSHLGSTFTALSAALSYKSIDPSQAAELATTHLAIVLGPSVASASAARARIVLELEGLRVALHTSASMQAQRCIALNGHLKENEGVHQLGNAMESSRPLSIRSRGLRDMSQHVERAEDSDEGSDEEGFDDSIVEDVPDSEPDSESTIEDSGSSSDIDSEDEEDSSENDEPSFVHEEAEADLCAAERLLSRTLAIANADPEQGMAAELRPTQIHILLRAPRRFAHPAWIPRQNLSRDMDPILREFHEPSCSSVSTSDPRANSLLDITNASQHTGRSAPANVKRKEPGGIKTECVRVRCRGGIDLSAGAHESHDTNEFHEHNLTEADETRHAEDEMIWWSWDGKLEGFADW